MKPHFISFCYTVCPKKMSPIAETTANLHWK